MFNRSKAVLTAVCILYAGEIAAMCAILAITLPKFEFTSQCLITVTPTLFPPYW